VEAREGFQRRMVRSLPQERQSAAVGVEAHRQHRTLVGAPAAPEHRRTPPQPHTPHRTAHTVHTAVSAGERHYLASSQATRSRAATGQCTPTAQSAGA